MNDSQPYTDNFQSESCCSIETNASTSESRGDHDDHDHGPGGIWTYVFAGFSLVMLLSGLALKHWAKADFFGGWIEIAWYVIAYLPVAIPVLIEAWHSLKSGELFTEFFLMSIATIGAFGIGEYPEGVAVMLFYAVGELFQSAAVKRAKNNIQSLLDLRPTVAHVYRNGTYQDVHPETVAIGEKIQVMVGENIPLDGKLLSETGLMNTAALTGESLPSEVERHGKVYAGSINLDRVVEVEVQKEFKNSSMSRILALVQDATSRKSKTELLIRRLAKIYTPIVVYLAIAITLIPFFFVSDYVFSDWLYRALIFLVISCPCALVISIPLGYFGGLGAASKHGLLFKGATFLDRLTKMNTLVMDKTGTVTKGQFEIKEIKLNDGWKEEDLMSLVVAVESKSNHPIAKTIAAYSGSIKSLETTSVEEVSGKGVIARVEDHHVAVGNKKLMEQVKATMPNSVDDIVDTVVLVAVDGIFAGYITLADELKDDALGSIQAIRKAGIKEIVMLSGDKDSITQSVAKQLGIDRALGGLLPEDKLKEVEKIKIDVNRVVGFVGDGINDAPVLAISDIGIAMGNLGSDVAIETADVIIQTDQPSKIALGIKIANSTQKIIYQNITLAFGVKILVLILGAMGMATMWQAVFADVGVALLAILNAMRLQGMRWS